MLNESITFSVNGYDYDENPKNLFDVAWQLSGIVYRQVVLKKLNPFQISRAKEKGDFYEYIITDGGDHHEMNGVINFYITDVFKPILNDCVEVIKKTLSDLKLNYGEFRIEKSQSRNCDVMRMPVSIPETDIAPELNMSNANYREVFNFLGYDGTLNSGVINASELLMKLSKAEKDLNNSDMRDMGRMKLDNPTLYTGDRKGNNIYSRELGKDNYLRYFEELMNLCKWCLKNGYKEISFG
jgi:hypothetical protein